MQNLQSRRIGAVGISGTGKTTRLLDILLRTEFEHFFILDWKGDIFPQKKNHKTVIVSEVLSEEKFYEVINEFDIVVFRFEGEYVLENYGQTLKMLWKFLKENSDGKEEGWFALLIDEAAKFSAGGATKAIINDFGGRSRSYGAPTIAWSATMLQGVSSELKENTTEVLIFTQVGTNALKALKESYNIDKRFIPKRRFEYLYYSPFENIKIYDGKYKIINENLFNDED
jgi:hypothetical protein